MDGTVTTKDMEEAMEEVEEITGGMMADTGAATPENPSGLC
jgi:hypothetical protein